MNLPPVNTPCGFLSIVSCHDEAAARMIERLSGRGLNWVRAAGRPARRSPRRTAALVASALSLPLGLLPLPAAFADPQAAAAPASPTAPGSSQAGDSIFLSLRRSSAGVDVVIEGTGATPVLQQARNGNGWAGQLTTARTAVLRYGPQSLSLPEAGIQNIRLQGEGSSYQIQVVPMPGLPLSRPVVGADGRNLVISFSTVPQLSSQTARANLRSPGSVPQATYAPPLQPRAVAPALGDMAVGTMVIRNRGFIKLSGQPVTMTVRDADARGVLMALAESAGYGFAYVPDTSTITGVTPNSVAKPDEQLGSKGPMVTMSFQKENFSRAFNAVLLSTGLQAKLEGRLLLVGPNVLGKTFGNQISKVYRLNQASAHSAADYLASLGAAITKVAVASIVTSTGTSQSQQIAGAAATSQEQRQDITSTQTYGASTGPLKGLSGTTDSRLQTITLMGDSSLIAVAEGYLRQLDLRQRQVALSVKILDINLQNDATLSNSFAFRYGNNFIVNDGGKLIGAWGNLLPPTSSQAAGQFNTLAGDASAAKPVYVTRTVSDSRTGITTTTQEVQQDLAPAPVNPGTAYNPNTFYNLLNAAITSSSTKVLASPTLILTDNPEPITGGASAGVSAGGALLGQASIGRERSNESWVTVGTQVITSYGASNAATGTSSNIITCTPTFGTAGLGFGARVTKIDDNGFVTFNLSPAVSATTGIQNVTGCGPINILSIRRLDTGSVRVRDGQTLILTGVISDLTAQTATKWPILGDLPLIGQFFRSSGTNREKRELVIMVTPHIINDTEGGTYGYGYQPSTSESRQFLGASQGGV